MDNLWTIFDDDVIMPSQILGYGCKESNKYYTRALK